MAYNLSDFVNIEIAQKAALNADMMLIGASAYNALRQATLTPAQLTFDQIERWAERDLWQRAGWR